MSILLAPSILAADFYNLQPQFESVEVAGATHMHLDVMDGVFVPQITFGMPVIKSIRNHTSLNLDCHLMVQDPDRYVHDFVQAGADILSIHLEAAKDPGHVITKIHEEGCRAGLALNPGTPIEAAEPYLKDLDLLVVMSVNPGFGGQRFIPSTITKLREARRIVSNINPKVRIEVDGGIKPDNVATVMQAGADVIVAGSAIFAGDVRANTEKMLSRIREFEEKQETAS